MGWAVTSRRARPPGAFTRLYWNETLVSWVFTDPVTGPLYLLDEGTREGKNGRRGGGVVEWVKSGGGDEGNGVG